MIMCCELRLRSTPRYRLVCICFPTPGRGLTHGSGLGLSRCLGPGECLHSFIQYCITLLFYARFYARDGIMEPSVNVPTTKIPLIMFCPLPSHRLSARFECGYLDLRGHMGHCEFVTTWLIKNYERAFLK